MTLVKYLMSTEVCKTGELLELKRIDPDGYATIMKWAREQAAANGVQIEETVTK